MGRPMPDEATSWWAVRWLIASDRRRPSSARLWAAAEIACAVATLSTLAAALALILLPTAGLERPDGSSTALVVLLSGAVGYGTNFLAVQMLFKPRRPVTWIPMRWIWPQGLVPARQIEMAEAVGEEVAGKLLTPEAIVEELARMARASLENPEIIARLQEAFRPAIERRIPDLVLTILPEAIAAVEDFLEDERRQGEFHEAVRQVVEGWFAREENRARLADELVAFLQAQTPVLMKVIKKAVKRYKNKSGFRRFGFDLGKATNIIDWADLEVTIRNQIGRDRSRQWLLGLVDDLSLQIGGLYDRLVADAWLDDMKAEAGRFIRRSADVLAREHLVPRAVRFVGSEAFGTLLADRLLPRMKVELLDWIHAGHFDRYFEDFDVRGRVADAAGALDVAELEAMANRVAAYHLGAIQVLGYALGLLAGLLMLMATR